MNLNEETRLGYTITPKMKEKIKEAKAKERSENGGKK